MRTLIAAATLLALVSPSQADAEIPFPQLDTFFYCTQLVSKMLNKDEQKVEMDKCTEEERTLKAALEPYWPIVRPPIRKEIMEFIPDPRYHSYTMLLSLENQEIGLACVKKIIDCFPPP